MSSDRSTINGHVHGTSGTSLTEAQVFLDMLRKRQTPLQIRFRGGTTGALITAIVDRFPEPILRNGL